MKKYISVNIFENEKYRINKIKDGFNDSFEINEENDILYIKRLDTQTGWGANLKFKFFDKIENNEYIKEIGSSETNKIKIQLDARKSINHYENNFYKIYPISDYNDIFNIKYNELSKELEIKRLDDDTGWDQNLILEYYEKHTKNVKHLTIGPSKKNIKNTIINLDKINYIKVPNYYCDNICKIEKFKNNYDDKFNFEMDHDNLILIVKRIDADEGWGQNLMVHLIYNNINYDIYIGSSNTNLYYKKINLSKFQVYICLTTIPSRASKDILIKNINNFIKNQTYDFDKILITIPKKYKRFDNNIDNKIIKKLEKIEKVEIIYIDKDLGPASKYLGPLIKKNINDQDLLIIIDDDRIYNKYLVRNLVMIYRSFYQYEFYSGLWSYFFDKKYKYLENNFLEVTMYKENNEDNFKFGNGLGGFFGFAMNIKNKKEFIQYNLKILELIDKSFYHDEGILLGYIKKKEKIIIYLKHIGCEEYDKETVDALCKSGLCNRSIIEKDILYITNYQSLL